MVAVFVVLLQQRFCAKPAFLLFFCHPLIDFVFLFSLLFWTDKFNFFHCDIVARLVALAAITPSVVVENRNGVQERIIKLTFVANMALCCDFVLLPVFCCHHNRMQVRKNLSGTCFLLHDFRKKCTDSIFSPVKKLI